MISEQTGVTMRGSGTRDELLDRARELAPRLAERCERAEQMRDLPEETVRDFHDAGLFRVLQPRRVGGTELDYGILVDLGAVVARACASSAWTLTNLASHHWMLAMFPPAAQDEIWGADENALIAASFIFPAGRAQKVAKGYALSGRWPFCTGVDICSWTMLGAIVGGEDENEPAEYRLFLLPRTDYTIVDTWHAGGLVAIGSNDVEVKEAFVPVERSLAVDDTKGGETPGGAVNPGRVYRIPVFATFPYVRVGTPLGIADAAIEAFTGTSSQRMTSYTTAILGDRQAVQIRIAEASACVDAARMMMTANCAEAQRIAEAGDVPDMLSKVRYRRDGAFAVSLCARAVDLLYEAGGGGAIYLRNRLQRAFRDIHAVRAHIGFNTDTAGSAYGRVALGHAADNPTL
jgi:3-hydroxy-9,10-secoandrosta-1,3,5(10)-triene-9,17-dione monooxygenase